MQVIRNTLFVFLGFLLFVFSHFPTFGQKTSLIKRSLNYLLNDTTATNRPKFIAYPTIAYAPETSWEFGASALLVYYANQDTSNRLSEINVFTFLTLEKQYGLWLDHALYSDKSTWFFLGKMRLQQFPLLYFGIGPDVTGEELAEIEAGSISLRERFLRNITGNLYLGLELDIQKLNNVKYNPIVQSIQPPGVREYTNLGLGLGFVYDDRHNVLNVRQGFFGETGFLRYNNLWGSDFEFTSFFLDTRYFKPFGKNKVWASQIFMNQIDGNAPFNQLSLMGGEMLMRGYYLGRYRDNTLMAGQTELRFLPFSFSKRWGAAAFFSVGTVASSPRELDFSNLKASGGAGVRFMIFPNKDTFTRFDVAFSEDGPGYYFFIGEAF